MRILVTGCCGFIGFHLCKKLIKLNHDVFGIDNFNSYYDVNLKRDRCRILKLLKMNIMEGDLCDNSLYIPDVDIIIHLAASSGVRYSIKHPEIYIQNNIVAFHNILSIAKQRKVERFIYASSASVYGANKPPWDENMILKEFLSLYSVTKVTSENIAALYAKMFNIKCVGLRFFNVYGTFGRPDSAIWIWTNNILHNKSVDIYNFGKMERCWTYVNDIVNGIILTISLDFMGHQIFNLGNEKSINIDYAVDFISNYIGVKAKKNYLPMQDADIKKSGINLEKSKNILKYEVKIDFEDGIKKFIDWFKIYKKI